MVKLQDRYKLENHFIRRRIQILRERVLLRKFGYLFFRKTISNILPSIANNFFLRSLLKKAFKKLEMNWYQGRIEWKHNLRAELHYNFILKKRAFQKLAMFYVAKKTKRVKTTIAEIMFEKKFQKRILKSTFNHWKHFAYRKKTSKLKNAIADQHFKSQFRTERIRFYFIRWKIFTKNRRSLRMKMEEAYRYYKIKLVTRVFNAFFSYITYRRMRRSQIERVSHFYANKLKQKMFNKLVSYRMYKSFQRDRIKFAINFYRKKLLRQAMRSFWSNLERRLYKKERLSVFAERKINRMKACYFNYWRMYTLNKKIKQQKYLKASELYDTRCKKKYFRKLKIYRLHRRQKKEYQKMKLFQLRSIFDRRILVICFNAWKSFTYNRKIKKEKLQLADMNHETLLKKKYLYLWINFKIQMKLEKRKVIEIQLFFYHKSLQRYFNIWKIFSSEQRTFALKKADANKYYKTCLIRQAFKLFIKAAFREKDDNLDRYLEKERRQLMLAQKYARTWRIKSKNSRTYKREKFSWKETNSDLTIRDDKPYDTKHKQNNFSHSFVGNFPESFIWDPMCFAIPRVPEYMKKYHTDS